MILLVEIDFALGTRVFGYRDLKNGKFQPRSNYSFKIDAFCDGKRHVYIFRKTLKLKTLFDSGSVIQAGRLQCMTASTPPIFSFRTA